MDKRSGDDTGIALVTAAHALALVKVLSLAPGVEIGLLVLAVSAGAPLLPRKLMKIGDGAYIFSLVVTSSLLAILLVPAWLAVLGALFDYPVSLRPDRARSPSPARSGLSPST